MTDTIFPINITKNGTFTLPAKLKQDLGIQDRFFIFVQDEQAVIKTPSMTLDQIYGSVKPIKKSNSEINKIIKEEKIVKYNNI